MGNKSSRDGATRENERSCRRLSPTLSTRSINPFVSAAYNNAAVSPQRGAPVRRHESRDDVLVDNGRPDQAIFSLPVMTVKEDTNCEKVYPGDIDSFRQNSHAPAGHNSSIFNTYTDYGRPHNRGDGHASLYTRGSGDNSTVTSSTSMTKNSNNSRLTVNQAKEFFTIIFAPPVGELEVIACGAITQETYALLGSFLALLLHIKNRERWYMDPVMIALMRIDTRRITSVFPDVHIKTTSLNRLSNNDGVTGSASNSSDDEFEDRSVAFRSPGSASSESANEGLVHIPEKLSKQQVHQLNALRVEYNNMLRDRLIMIGNCNVDVSPSLCESTLHTLSRLYDCFVMKSASEQENSIRSFVRSFEQEMSRWTTPTASPATRGRSAIADALQKSKDGAGDYTGGGNASFDSKYSMDALFRTIGTSFQCLQMLGECIPPTLLDRLPPDYLLHTSPVLDTRMSLVDRCLDDIENRSFFVTLAQRIALMNGEVNYASNYDINRHANEIKKNLSMTDLFVESTDTPKSITTIRDFHIAMRNLSLLLTTAFSSMIIYVLINIAETARLRSFYRKLFRHNHPAKFILKEIFGHVCAGLDIFLTPPTETDLKHMLFVITDEMSLTVFTRLLLRNYRIKHSAHINQLKTRFNYLRRVFAKIGASEDQDEMDVTRLMGGVALKLMFLIGGGIRSIQADDRRPPLGDLRTVDDIALSHLLEVPLLSRICWVACILGMPVLSQGSTSVNNRLERPFTFAEADECAGVMRELFQSVGALPLGSRCPPRFTNWLPIFPLYAVGLEGKRILLYLYSVQSCGVRPLELTVQKDMMLLSFAAALKENYNFSRRERANYIFKPKFIVGDSRNSLSAVGAQKLRKSATSAIVPPEGNSANYTHATSNNKEHQHHHHSSGKGEKRPNGGRSQTVANSTAKASFTRSRQFSKKDLPSRASENTGGPVNHDDHGSGAIGKINHNNNRNDSGNITRGDDTRTYFSSIFNGRFEANKEEEESTTTTESSPADVGELTPQGAAVSLPLDKMAANGKSNEYNFSMLSLNSTLVMTRPPSILGISEPDRASTGTMYENTDGGNSSLKSTTSLTSNASELSESSVSSLHSSSSSSSSSFSSEGSELLSGEMEVDVYTCVSAQEQLYLRCSNEATVKRHKATELTPFVQTQMYNSTVSLTRVYPEMRRAIRAQIPILLPNEHLLVLHWVHGEPTVTLRNGDYLPVLIKRTASRRMSSSNVGGVYNHHIHHSLTQGAMELSASGKSDNPLLAHQAAAYYQLEPNMLLDMTLRDVTQMIETTYSANSTSGSHTGSHANSDSGNSSTSQVNRFGTCFTIERVVSCRSAFASTGDPANHSCTTMDVGAAQRSPENADEERIDLTSADVILHIKTSGLSSHDQFEVVNIGHERASMSPFHMMDASKTVCWANPHLLTALLSGGGAAEAMNGRRDAPLCNTLTELHGVFFSIGVLLANSIANGVFLPIPLPPLLFALIKKALMTGDYNFDNVMWLEPCDGNLLSPTTILNSAYAILTMTDSAYYDYVKKRGLCHQRQGSGVLRGSQGDLYGSSRLGESSMLFETKNPALNRLAMSQTLSSAQNIYMNDTHKYNAVPMWSQQEFFYDNKELENGTSTPARQNEGKRYIERLKQRTCAAVERFSKHILRGGEGSGRLHVHSNNTYYELPSRSEYIILYLVNELAWSSVCTENTANQTKDLWVSFLRGFMTSPMARSPLFSHCCSRVVREVLCMPPRQKEY